MHIPLSRRGFIAAGAGLTLDPGQRFRVDLTNALDAETIIYWRGQIPPNAQDGAPDLPMPKLMPGEMRSYDFAPQPGTHAPRGAASASRSCFTTCR